MEKIPWHKIFSYKKRYVNRLIEGGMHIKVALDLYRAGIDDIDYSVSPEGAARDELTYWAE